MNYKMSRHTKQGRISAVALLMLCCCSGELDLNGPLVGVWRIEPDQAGPPRFAEVTSARFKTAGGAYDYRVLTDGRLELSFSTGARLICTFTINDQKMVMDCPPGIGRVHYRRATEEELQAFEAADLL